MTITLKPDIEQRLREKAKRDGEDMDMLANSLLTAALEWEAQDELEAVEGIRRGLEAFEQGRNRRFSDFASEQRAKYDLSSSSHEIKDTSR